MRKLTLLVAMLLVSTSLFAQDQPDWRNRRSRRKDPDPYTKSDRYRDLNAFEVTPMIGYRYGGTIFASDTNLFKQNVDVASAMDYGVNFGIPIADGYKLDLMVSRQDTHFTSGGGGLFSPNDNIGDFHVTYFQGGLEIPFSVSRNATPYVVVSAGVANLKPDIAGVSSDTRFAASGGVGVKVPISRGVGFRFEARGYFTSMNNNRDNCSRCYYTYNHDLYQGETNFGLYLRF